MFWNHFMAVYSTPESVLLHKEESIVIYEQKKPAILPPEAVIRARYTCRNEQGEVRLMPKASVEEALERLCRIEEKLYGVLIKRRPGKEANHAKED